jgi:hypothetical protein
MIRRLLLTCFVLLLFPYSSFAEFTGLVVSVLDGDTLEILHNTRAEQSDSMEGLHEFPRGADGLVEVRW